MKLTELVAEGAIVAPARSVERDALMSELLGLLAEHGVVEPSLVPELLGRVMERERRGSTGFGCGIAVPHVKHKSIKGISAAIGLVPRGMDFSALDKQPVYTVILLVSPEDQPDEHLRAMEAIFTCLSKDSFRRALRGAQSQAEVRELLGEGPSATAKSA